MANQSPAQVTALKNISAKLRLWLNGANEALERGDYEAAGRFFDAASWACYTIADKHDN